MKVLVSTKETQGARSNDFSWVPEGELVKTSGSECSSGTVDDQCGCTRAFVGMTTSSACTTAKVIEMVDVTAGELAGYVWDELKKGGWFDSEGGLEPRKQAKWVAEEVCAIVQVAEAFEAGRVIERRGAVFQVRSAK